MVSKTSRNNLLIVLFCGKKKKSKGRKEMEQNARNEAQLEPAAEHSPIDEEKNKAEGKQRELLAPGTLMIRFQGTLYYSFENPPAVPSGSQRLCLVSEDNDGEIKEEELKKGEALLWNSPLQTMIIHLLEALGLNLIADVCLTFPSLELSFYPHSIFAKDLGLFHLYDIHTRIFGTTDENPFLCDVTLFDEVGFQQRYYDICHKALPGHRVESPINIDEEEEEADEENDEENGEHEDGEAEEEEETEEFSVVDTDPIKQHAFNNHHHDQSENNEEEDIVIIDDNEDQLLSVNNITKRPRESDPSYIESQNDLLDNGVFDGNIDNAKKFKSSPPISIDQIPQIE